MFFKREKPSADRSKLEKIDKTRLPKHIAIIMDGNGRWAKKKNMPRAYGHKSGVEAIREVVKACSNLGVSYLTLYAFSTENWKRPVEEVNLLMNLLVEYLKREVQELHDNNVAITAIGDISGLPEVCQRELEKAHEKTRDNTGLRLILALNYGSRHEIKTAVQRLATDVKENNLDIKDIDENIISNYLYTSGVPDPDLLIRPSGEFRISNFLLWQIAYSELWFTDTCWPDFKPDELYDAILDFQGRDRRFGGLK